MTSAVRPFRGVSAAERQAQRRARLIDACLTVVSSEGLLDVTVDRVCHEARLTKRYLYESFANLDELLEACADTMFGDLLQRMEGATAGMARGVAKARHAVGAVISALAADPRYARLYIESAAHPRMQARRDAAIDTFAAFMMAEIVRTDPASPGLELRARIVVAGATDLITAVLRETVAASIQDVVDAVIAVSADL